MFEHVWHDLEFPNLLFPLKYYSTTLRRELNDLKCFTTTSLWPSNDLSTMLCHQSFLVQCLPSAYWKLLVFLESIWSLFNSKTASRVRLIIFIALMVSPTITWLNLVYMCCYSSLSINHVGHPIMNPSIVNSTQGILKGTLIQIWKSANIFVFIWK